LTLQKNWWSLILVLAGLVLFKLWVTEAHEFLARFRPHDDTLFLQLAAGIADGSWLGDFSNRTLIKGPGYPLFIVLVNRLGIPLLMAQQLLYALACIAVFAALLPLSRSRLAACLVFILLLFNPASFNDPVVNTALRESFYLSLALLVMACLVALGTGDGRLGARNLGWSLLLGLAAAWLWITREESVWVIPGMVFMALWFVPPWPWHRRGCFIHRLLLVLVPVLMVTATLTGVRRLNETHYHVPHVVDIKSPEFISALGGLMNIQHEEFARTQVVSAGALGRAMAVSPSLEELAPGFYGNRYPASFFIWTLRSAARQAGYYEESADGRPSLELYRRIGEEIAAACAAQTLSCLNRAPTLRPPWLPEHWRFVPQSLWDVTRQAIGFSGFNVYSMRYPGASDDAYLAFSAEITGEHPERRLGRNQQTLPGEYLASRERREYLMKRFVNVYQYLAPLLMISALLVHIRRIHLMLRHRRYEPVTVAALIPLGSILTLIAMLTYVLVTLWPITRPLHTVYPIVLLYAGMMLAGKPMASQPSRDS
jgi:hypothetical protein